MASWPDKYVVFQESSPTINQELVATLMEVLMTHDDANRAVEHALKSHDQIQAQEGEADDLKVCIDSAAVLDSRLTAVEWTQIALVALQGTQVLFRFTRVSSSPCLHEICPQYPVAIVLMICTFAPVTDAKFVYATHHLYIVPASFLCLI